MVQATSDLGLGAMLLHANLSLTPFDYIWNVPSLHASKNTRCVKRAANYTGTCKEIPGMTVRLWMAQLVKYQTFNTRA